MLQGDRGDKVIGDGQRQNTIIVIPASSIGFPAVSYQLTGGDINRFADQLIQLQAGGGGVNAVCLILRSGFFDVAGTVGVGHLATPAALKLGAIGAADRLRRRRNAAQCRYDQHRR